QSVLFPSDRPRPATKRTLLPADAALNITASSRSRCRSASKLRTGRLRSQLPPYCIVTVPAACQSVLLPSDRSRPATKNTLLPANADLNITFKVSLKKLPLGAAEVPAALILHCEFSIPFPLPFSTIDPAKGPPPSPPSFTSTRLLLAA